MKNILIGTPIHHPTWQRLQSNPNIKCVVIPPLEQSREVDPSLLRDVEIVFCSLLPANFVEMRRLEFVQINSAGYTQLFNLGLAEKKIRASNARGVFDSPIAEWCLAMMVNLVRDLRGMIRNHEARIWDRSARFQREIHGCRVGIWGYGSLGRETARLAKACGMKISVLDRCPPSDMTHASIYRAEGTGDPAGILPDCIFVTGQEKDFLSDLDFLILTMPLTHHTKGIVGEAELKSLPSTAYVLNPARGPLIQEEALLKCLREGWIAGAALDTHYYYPMPADHPLWSFPNVIMTPHISGSTLSPGFLEKTWDIFEQNVHRILENKPILNELSPSQLNGD